MWRVLLATVLLASTPAIAQSSVWVVDIEGAIGPATADHVIRNIDSANLDNAEAIIVRMNTPGGLDGAMRDIIQAILKSKTPVIGYVAPQGSRAASAGTYVLYASHIAAMAPATNLGAATPVQIGGAPSLPFGDSDKSKGGDEESEDQSGPEMSGDAMQHKIINDARAYIRSLAELRNRNLEWAEKAVVEAATLTATQALEQGVIDIVAEDEQSLLAAIAGRTVTTAAGTRTLNTADSAIKEITPDWRTEFLTVITNPSVAYFLLMAGIYGLFLEFSNPGLGVGGVIGAICLFLALYALQLLPISYSALGLMLLGLGLMVAEAFSPSFGILGLGGVIAFVVGSIMLMDTDVPGFQIALPLILALAAVSVCMLIIVVGLMLKTRRRAVVSGLATLEGKSAQVVGLKKNDQVLVRIEGELWNAHCASPLAIGDRVQVERAAGLMLYVTKEE